MCSVGKQVQAQCRQGWNQDSELYMEGQNQYPLDSNDYWKECHRLVILVLSVIILHAWFSSSMWTQPGKSPNRKVNALGPGWKYKQPNSQKLYHGHVLFHTHVCVEGMGHASPRWGRCLTCYPCSASPSFYKDDSLPLWKNIMSATESSKTKVWPDSIFKWNLLEF